ncbi:MAG: tRNA (adenosine(37)-N6)-threonylcarbamoyltransferase complex dimerization subunit type 1 TsaB, partial [Verrucomicrobiaceae bacterium]
MLWAVSGNLRAQEIRSSEFPVSNTGGALDNVGTPLRGIEIWNPSRTVSQTVPNDGSPTGHTSYTCRDEAANAAGAQLGEELPFITLNRSPVAQDQEFHFPTRTPFALDVLTLASDPDGDALSISEVTQGVHGAVTTDGETVTYTPGESYAGNDTFTYTITDGFGGTDSATVTLSNVAPVATEDALITNGSAVTFDPRVNDLDADGDAISVVAVTAGPGSYTGLRVGMATAKGICYALDIPLITESTLYLLAQRVNKEQSSNRQYDLPVLICPMIDARRMEVFTTLYDSELNELKPAGAVILDQDSFREELARHIILFCGSGIKKW